MRNNSKENKKDKNIDKVHKINRKKLSGKLTEKDNNKTKSIELNMGFMVLKIIAIMLIISLATAQTVRTIIQARTTTSESETEAETTKEEATYYMVDSTEIDEETGEYIQVPVPVGYTASQIEGETGVSTGFVIYEGDIDWSEIIEDDETSTASEEEITPTSLDEDDNVNQEESTEESDDADTESTKTTDSSSNESGTSEENGDTVTSSENANNDLNENQDIAEEDTDDTDNTENETADEENSEDEYENEENSVNENTTVTSLTAEVETLEASTTVDYYLSEYGYSEEESEAIWDLQCSTTQWVWIPVSEEDLETIYGVDENGKYWGKLYSATSKTTAENWTETNGVMSITSATGYREPDITPLLTAYDTDEMLTSYLNGITRYELLKELEENYYKTIESIMKYGGFYVGRYETGDLNQTEASITKCNTNIASQTWYVMYEKCEGLARGNTNVRTSMIWDSLYDYIYRWFIDSGATKQDGTLLEESEIWSGTNGGSRSWGNYAGSAFTYYTDWDTTAEKTEGQTLLFQTGISYYTAINNVFDLAGDVSDRTLCVYDTQYVVWRGDNCDGTGTDFYAAYRSGGGVYREPTYSNAGYGCRAVLLLA